MKKLLQTIFVLCLAGNTLKAQCFVASAGPDQTVCAGATVTLAANPVGGYILTWTKVGGFFAPAGVITNTASPTSTLTGLTGAETLRLVWTITDQASCTSRDTVVINVQTPPTAANAGADQTICAGGTATLAATAPTGGSTGIWTKVLTGAHTTSSSVITSVSSPTTTVTGLNSAGINDTLRWTVTNATCGGTATDDVIIKVNVAPTLANAGSDQQTCQGDTVQLVGNTPTLGTPSWTLPTGSGAAFIAGNGSLNNDTVKVRGGTAGGKISIVYGISNGAGATALNGCKSVDTVVVSFNPSVANAGPDQSICQTPATITLAATPIAAGETGHWSIIKIKPSGSVAVITNTLSPTTTVTGITSDTLTLRWTVNGGGCSDTDDMNVIKLTAPSIAVAGPNASGANDITGCVGDTIQLTGSPATSGTPSWTRTAGDVAAFNFTCFCNQFNDPFIPANGNSNAIQVALLKAGTYKLYYTISVGTSTVTGTCSTSRDSLNIFVNALPTATIVGPAGGAFGGGSPNQTDCSSTSATTYTVTARKPATGTGVWSIVTQPGTGTVVQNDTIGIVSGLAQGVTTLAWTVNNGICTRKATMTITASAPTTANAGNDITNRCVGDTITLYGSIATSGTPTWSNAHPPATVGGLFGFGGTTPKSIKFIPTNGRNDTVKVVLDTAGTFTLYYTIKVGTSTVTACTSRDSMKITVTKCTTGITENSTGGLTVSIQPNPASELFSLSVKDTKTSFAEVSILGTDGRIIETEQLGTVKDIVKTINISNLSNGLYFVKVKKGDEIFVTKLVVQ